MCFEDYYVMKFKTAAGKNQVLSFHTHGHKITSGFKSIPKWHWQLQKWNPMTKKLLEQLLDGSAGICH